jgi:two-component system sensor histidine kinase DegS
MDFDRDDLLDDSNPKQELIDMLSQEVKSTKQRMSEIKDQIDSMQSSVDKEQNKYSSLASELRTIKDNLDTVPREDIRDKYDEALQVRFRLATMRGQIEKYEANYEYLETQQTTLVKVLNGLQGFESLPDDDMDSPTSGRGLDIVGIIRAQEDERQRLARAMHDGPAQSLTNFILQAEICQRLFDRNPDRAAEELNNLKSNASKTFQKIRDFIFDLRPMMLDDLGVAPTVRRYVESYREKNDIETNLELVGEERRFENYLEVMIFRSVQDVMSVARDYASASTIKIRLDMSGDPIRVMVEDDGQGFDPAEVLEDESEDTNQDARVQALTMLKSKLELIGGNMQITSDETEGTSVRMELPSG